MTPSSDVIGVTFFNSHSPAANDNSSFEGLPDDVTKIYKNFQYLYVTRNEATWLSNSKHIAYKEPVYRF